MTQDIVTTVAGLEDFITRALSPDVPKARSLTMIININQLPSIHPNQPALPEDDERDDREGSPSAKRLWDQLQRLADEILPHLSSLASFSVVVVSKGRDGFWIPRPLIATLLDALPLCRVDTRGHDRCEPGSGHLCEAFRALLPRLRHVRLRLSTMCGFLFGSGQESQTIESSLDSQTAPALETVLINCMACMQSFVARCPQLKQMSLIDVGQDDYDNRSVYPSFNRLNILQDKILCMPFTWVALSQSYGVLLRTLNRGDVLSSHDGLQALTEDQMWQKTSEGSSLPAEIFTARDYEDEDIPVLSAEAWKEKYPKQSCGLWWNEKKTG